jgi:hypothetical protein
LDRDLSISENFGKYFTVPEIIEKNTPEPEMEDHEDTVDEYMRYNDLDDVIREFFCTEDILGVVKSCMNDPIYTRSSGFSVKTTLRKKLLEMLDTDEDTD